MALVRLKNAAAYALTLRMTRSILPAALLTLTALSACGRQEPVDDLPTQEELIAAAKAVAENAANATAEAAENRNYVNVEHGFSITFPEGWTRDAGASAPEGVVYEDPGAGADIRVFWSKNDNDADMQKTVEAINNGSDSVDGDFIGDNEYRGTANDGEGNNIALRLLKQPDGSIVTATFVYPEILSEQYRPISRAALDSLRIFAPKEASSADGADASEGANAAAR